MKRFDKDTLPINENAYPSCLTLDKIEAFPSNAFVLEGSISRALSKDCRASSYLCK